MMPASTQKASRAATVLTAQEHDIAAVRRDTGIEIIGACI